MNIGKINDDKKIIKKKKYLNEIEGEIKNLLKNVLKKKWIR